VPAPAAPSTGDVGLREKAREWLGFLERHRRRLADDEIPTLLSDVEEYDALLQRFCGRALHGAEMLEIGFGTQAERMAILHAAGAKAIGVDIEVPMFDFGPRTLREIQRRNGLERLAKSAGRHLLFDRASKRRLEEAIAAAYPGTQFGYGRLVIGDAADLDLPDASLDLVTSEDVFEHMTPDSISRALAGVRRWLRPGAVALIRPNVYTGISGGHLREWSVNSVRDRPEEPRESAPWEHLRAGRYQPNTFLNRLTRADYRAAFAEAGFEILEERPRYPELGATLLSAEIRAELSEWPDEELFSNQTLFVLRPPAASA
jgi:ubiquinone/menaquinone biosynthesis C-methylase UbiE